MSQYYRLMSWCRIPGHAVDSYIEACKPGNDFYVLLIWEINKNNYNIITKKMVACTFYHNPLRT